MHFNSLVLLGSAFAVANAAITSSTTLCVTKSGAKSPTKAVPTKSTTVFDRTTLTTTRTVHPTTTTTLPADTTTVTETTNTEVTTTLSTQTDTVTSTDFETTTTTVEASPVTVTSTETDTATTTTTVGPFFTGVQDTLPNADPYGGSRKKREAVEQPKAGLSNARRNMLLARAGTTSYAQKVTCSTIYHVTSSTYTTVTTKPTITSTTQSAQSTSTSTVTITGTSTVVPSDASTTVTTTSTITNTETDTATSTSTATTTTTNTVTVQAVPTVACDSSNYASSVNGATIINGTPQNNAEDFYFTSASSVDACCASCAGNPSCGAFFFTSNSQCANAIDSGTCSVNSDPFTALLGTTRTKPIIVGNGICGAWTGSSSQ